MLLGDLVQIKIKTHVCLPNHRYFFPSYSHWLEFCLICIYCRARGFAAYKLQEDCKTWTQWYVWVQEALWAENGWKSTREKRPMCLSTLPWMSICGHWQRQGTQPDGPTWVFPHSLVIRDSFSANHVDGGIHDVSVKSCDYCKATGTHW